MKTINKFKKGGFVLNEIDFGARAMLMDNKICLCIEDIADIFNLAVEEARENLAKILLDTQLSLLDNVYKIYNEELEEAETFYGIDLIISLGYRVKCYRETKYLIHANRVIKSYNITPVTRYSSLISNAFRSISEFIKSQYA